MKLERINSFLDAAISLKYKYKYKCPNCGMEKVSGPDKNNKERYIFSPV